MTAMKKSVTKSVKLKLRKLGESELENKNISVRKRREKDTVTMDTDEFINNLLEEIKTKAQ